MLPDFSDKKLIYTSCYCEENIYHLCKELDDIKNKFVVLYQMNILRINVYDLDTTLPFPCDFSTYTQESFKVLNIPQYYRKFRIIPAETFLRVFASDRSHMDGTWSSPPPTYPPIFTSDSVNNLQTFINMIENLDSNDFGKVLEEDDFRNYFFR
ncbi:10001_t:CDS:2 [Rhizophagus irregularis]|nr:10001_t:CDS:2 [Rhizophagus irregularis]